jgi:hypothetical protein
MEEVKQEEN